MRHLRLGLTDAERKARVDAMSGCQVTFQPVGKRVAVPRGLTLLEAGRVAGLALSANCGGIGVCGRCRIDVLSGSLDDPGAAELSCISHGDLVAGIRLACRARVRTDVSVQVPAGFLSGAQRLQHEGDSAALVCDPLIEKCQVNLTGQDANVSTADLTRLSRELTARLGSRPWSARPEAIVQLSRIARQDNGPLTAYLRRGEILGLAGTGSPALGIAIDLGCTKIAAYLVDLHSGEQLGAGGVANPQIAYGEDLISRLVHANRGADAAGLLARVAREAIDRIALELCATAKVQPQQVADLCIVGNTAMIHLLLELPVGQLLHAPFIASFDTGIDIAAWALGFRFAPGARVHIPPSIGGFVGADHVAMILASNIDRSKSVVIGIDVGTNTEIVLYRPDRKMMLNTSVPSGPAFEGGHIYDGMRAAAGAIERVASLGGTLAFKTIADEQPVGICGSGVVDLVAHLWRAGTINDRGHLAVHDPAVRKGGGGLEFLVVPAAQSGHGRDIVLTQKDISEVQLAKAAIHAGILVLLEIAELLPDQVEKLIVAGAFGSHLDLASAVDIGALPRLRNAHFAQVGNAAGAGAKMALVSRKIRARARRIAARATRIELKDHTNFNRLLARATRFPPHAAGPNNKEPKPDHAA